MPFIAVVPVLVYPMKPSFIFCITFSPVGEVRSSDDGEGGCSWEGRRLEWRWYMCFAEECRRASLDRLDFFTKV
jgi:hypothetical protein